jgi:glycogen debranching enzyme
MEGLVLSENRVFLVSDDWGDVRRDNGRGFGLYYLDTRFLSFLEFRINERRPDLLTASSEHNYFGNIQLTNPRLFVRGEGGASEEIAPQTVSIRRNRFIDGALHERIVFFNYNKHAIELNVSLTFAADFRDVFDVRGYYQSVRGEVLRPVPEGEPFTSSVQRVATLHYLGRDGALRRTILSFEIPQEATHQHISILKGGQRHRADRTKLPELQQAPPEVEVDPPGVRLRFRIWLEAQKSSSFIYYAQPTVDQIHPERPRARFDLAAAGIARSYQEEWLADCTRITTSDGVFDRMLDRGKVDIRALLAVYGQNKVPFAGIPWYAAPFGRDSLISAYQVLMLNPEVALGALRFLAERQGNEDSAWRDEEPGKILHEIRYGEYSSLALVPHLAYYGTSDATPLFLILFCEVMDWLDDDRLFVELWPNVERALEWIDRWGDRDGDGFVEYCSRSKEGLRNQTWKDSWDAYQYSDGRLV